MNKNQAIIDQITEKSTAIFETLGDRTESRFNLSDISIDEKNVYFKDMPMNEHAKAKALGMLKVKSNFSDFAKKMPKEDWSDLEGKLKSIEGNKKVYASIANNDNGVPEIVDVFLHKDGKKRNDDASYKQYFDWITDSLSKTEKTYSLKDMSFNPDNKNVNLVLLNEDKKIDVFGTDTDLWKGGDSFNFSGLQFNYAPFFERLVCSNGNRTQQYGFGADISKNTFNNTKIQGVIKKALEFGDENMPEVLMQAVNHLMQNNVSIQEFFEYRNFFKNRNQDDVYDRIISKFFNTNPFYKAYGLNIEEKSRKWRSTADSGINAYDFFNMLTWIASHPDKVSVDEEHRLDLQITASNLLFKPNLDLEDIATNVKFEYPKLVEMY
jgi:hypothetical protein